MENLTNPNRESIKYGVMLGLFSITTYLLTYLIDPTLLISMWYGLIILAITILLLVFVSQAIRKSNGGYITFGLMFQSLFIAMIISMVIGTAFQFLLFKVIDPSLEETLRTQLIDNTTQWMSNWGMSESEIEKATEGMQTQTFAPSAWSILGIVIGSAIIALIFAAIFKKKNKDADYEALLSQESNPS